MSRLAARVGRLRRRGARASSGSWTVFVAPGTEPTGCLVVSLGRAAGGAVVRSRIRRIARDVFRARQDDRRSIEILLLARDNVGGESRRTVRRKLHALFGRAEGLMVR